ncbi:nucleoplasmin-2 [Tenrec ecaudatus]|uniref:nucleoplasmin-2 n=1 Tax=Tenrec ecaudatus TaxID=94439 RepID=UPI003F5A0E3D
MFRWSTSSGSEKGTSILWGCELNQGMPTCTFKPQIEGKQDCKLLLTAICLGEKANKEMNLVEILPPVNQVKKIKPVTIASLHISILPMVSFVGLEFTPPVTFQLRAGSGPVLLSGQEYYDTPDLSWRDEEEEGDEEDSSSDEDDDEEDDEEKEALFSEEEEAPVKQLKRPAPQKQMSAAKKKKLEKEEEATRSTAKDKSPFKKAKLTPKVKKAVSKK